MSVEDYNQILKDCEKAIQDKFDKKFYDRMGHIEEHHLRKLASLEAQLGPSLPKDLLLQKDLLIIKAKALIKRNNSLLLAAYNNFFTDPDLARMMLMDKISSGPKFENPEVREEAQKWYRFTLRRFVANFLPIISKYARAAKGVDENYFTAYVILDNYKDILSRKENIIPEGEFIINLYEEVNKLATHEERLEKILEMTK